jgi:hypothetical protein
MDVDVGKLPNHLKLCVMYSGSILSSNSLQWTEIQRAVRFDAVPILSQKNPTYNWRRLWELHFKLRHCDISVYQRKVQG